jgi:hypothetical protein
MPVARGGSHGLAARAVTDVIDLAAATRATTPQLDSTRALRRGGGATNRAFDPLVHATEIALTFIARDLAVADVTFHLAALGGAFVWCHRGGVRTRRHRRRCRLAWWLLGSAAAGGEESECNEQL